MNTAIPLADSPMSVPPADWEGVIARATVLRIEDTTISGHLRILALDGELYVQEEAPGGRILLRRRPDRAAADRFVDQRLETYDRMWDGCGCRVDYSEP